MKQKIKIELNGNNNDEVMRIVGALLRTLSDECQRPQAKESGITYSWNRTHD